MVDQVRYVLTSEIGQALSRPTKSRPFWPARTPRWLLRCFDAAQANILIEGGVFQLNRVPNGAFAESAGDESELRELKSRNLNAAYSRPLVSPIPRSLAVYDTQEIPLETIQTIVSIDTRVPALYSDTHDQLQWQLQMAAEFVYETQEDLAFNHPIHGLLNNVDPSMEVEAAGPPSPDVLDDLLGLAWKRPDCFLMHPQALAEFHKAANAQSLNLEAVDAFGSSFTSWRGLPICPSDKLQLLGEAGESRVPPGGRQSRQTREEGWLPPIAADTPAQTVSSRRGGSGTTDVLLARIGIESQGVVCLRAAGTGDQVDMPGITIDFMGRSDNGVESHMLSMYCALAVLSPGALARARVII